MDAMQALRELTEISSQIEAACLFDASGTQAASTLADDDATRRFVDAARALLDAAASLPRGADAGPLAQLEAATLEGSVFVVLRRRASPPRRRPGPSRPSASSSTT